MNMDSSFGWEKYIACSAEKVSEQDIGTELTLMIIEDFDQHLIGKMPYQLSEILRLPQSVRMRKTNGLSAQDIVFCCGVVSELKSRFPDYIPDRYIPKFLEAAAKKVFL